MIEELSRELAEEAIRWCGTVDTPEDRRELAALLKRRAEVWLDQRVPQWRLLLRAPFVKLR